MKCEYCGKTVTKSQLDHGQAIKTGRGKYVHTDCLDDQHRHKDDAYYRDASGKRVNAR